MGGGAAAPRLRGVRLVSASEEVGHPVLVTIAEVEVVGRIVAIETSTLRVHIDRRLFYGVSGMCTGMLGTGFIPFIARSNRSALYYWRFMTYIRRFTPSTNDPTLMQSFVVISATSNSHRYGSSTQTSALLLVAGLTSRCSDRVVCIKRLRTPQTHRRRRRALLKLRAVRSAPAIRAATIGERPGQHRRASVTSACHATRLILR